MARDCLKREVAERIVFSDHFTSIELDDHEKELLTEGDSLLSVERGDSIWQE